MLLSMRLWHSRYLIPAYFMQIGWSWQTLPMLGIFSTCVIRHSCCLPTDGISIDQSITYKWKQKCILLGSVEETSKLLQIYSQSFEGEVWFTTKCSLELHLEFMLWKIFTGIWATTIIKNLEYFWHICLLMVVEMLVWEEATCVLSTALF